MNKNIFVFNTNKCVGCGACSVACMNENGYQSPERWRNIYSSNDQNFPNIPLFYLSIACNHCDDAPCMHHCPALAYKRDEKTNAVIINQDLCMGCKYCTWACPYDAPKFNPAIGTVEKCTFCYSRIQEELKPACTTLCPTGALDFQTVEFSREESKQNSPVPVDVGSNIKIEKLINKNGPEIDESIFIDQYDVEIIEKPKKKISAKEEWPLLIFTLICSFLVGLYTSGKSEDFNLIEKILFLLTAGSASLFSLFHLGKKERAWRSILNIKNSWLSREVFFFSIFCAFVFMEMFVFKIPKILTVLSGVLLLFSIDMLYSIATWRWKTKVHSAQVLLIGFSVFLIFMKMPVLFLLFSLARLIIYLNRKTKSEVISKISLLRIFFLIVSIVLIFFTYNPITLIFTFAFGEIIDRTEFYNELNVSHPIEEMKLAA